MPHLSPLAWMLILFLGWMVIFYLFLSIEYYCVSLNKCFYSLFKV